VVVVDDSEKRSRDDLRRKARIPFLADEADRGKPPYYVTMVGNFGRRQTDPAAGPPRPLRSLAWSSPRPI
jgi:hypothetical protein